MSTITDTPDFRRSYNYHAAYFGTDPWRTMKMLEAKFTRETAEGVCEFDTYEWFVMVKLDCPTLADAQDAVANYRDGVARQLRLRELEREAGL